MKKLDDISKIQRGASPRPISSKKRYDYVNKNVGWVRIGDVTSSSKYLTKTEDYFSQEGIKKSRFLPKGSLIMSICATIGKPIITEIDTCIHDGFVGFSYLNVNKEFLYYYLNILEPKFYSLSQTGSQANLNSDLVRISKIGVPSIKEQEQIVNFLSLVDKKIGLLEKKHQAYLDFKKYLMQQIFTQKLRFKNYDEDDFKDWKERKLSEFLVEHKLKSTGNEEVYSVSVHKGLVNQVEHLGRDFSASDTSKYNLVKYGDIVYTKSPTGDFPLGIIKQSRVNKDVIVSPLYGVFTPETYDLGYILNDYFESNVNTFNYLHPIVQKGAKNTMNITNKTFLSKSLFVPTDKREQHKISECLSKINKAINLIEIQIQHNIEFKKGLLQQMFV